MLFIQFLGKVISRCSSLSSCCGKGARASKSGSLDIVVCPVLRWLACLLRRLYDHVLFTLGLLLRIQRLRCHTPRRRYCGCVRQSGRKVAGLCRKQTRFLAGCRRGGRGDGPESEVSGSTACFGEVVFLRGDADSFANLALVLTGRVRA